MVVRTIFLGKHGASRNWSKPILERFTCKTAWQKVRFDVKIHFGVRVFCLQKTIACKKQLLAKNNCLQKTIACKKQLLAKNNCLHFAKQNVELVKCTQNAPIKKCPRSDSNRHAESASS